MKLLDKDKKGQNMGSLVSLVIGVFLIGLFVFMFVFTGSKIRSTLSNDTDNDSIAVINDTIGAVGEVPTYFSLIIVVGIVVFVLGLFIGMVSLFGRAGFGGGL